MKVRTHVPCQQYGFFEFEGTEKDLPKIEKLYNKYSEKPIRFSEGVFEKIITFTGEAVLYNSSTHEYTTLKGEKMVSGSAYKKSMEPPFDLERISAAVAKKYGITQETVKEMWKKNSRVSTAFGNSLHFAMEQWFLFRDIEMGEKSYHTAKPKFLREAVERFPKRNARIMPEVMISDVANLRVGQIDALEILEDEAEKRAIIIDYKSDADIKKTLDGHFFQLSFYAAILRAKGWDIPNVEVWNYTDKWECFERVPGEVV